MVAIAAFLVAAFILFVVAYWVVFWVRAWWLMRKIRRESRP